MRGFASPWSWWCAGAPPAHVQPTAGLDRRSRAARPGRRRCAASAWTRAFGGAEPAFGVLVRGAHAATPPRWPRASSRRWAVRPPSSVYSTMFPRPRCPGHLTLAWAFAGPEARARTCRHGHPRGMRARLSETAPADN